MRMQAVSLSLNVARAPGVDFAADDLRPGGAASGSVS